MALYRSKKLTWRQRRNGCFVALLVVGVGTLVLVLMFLIGTRVVL